MLMPGPQRRPGSAPVVGAHVRGSPVPTVAEGRGLRDRGPVARPPVLRCPSSAPAPPRRPWARGRGGHTASPPPHPLAGGEPGGGACREARCLGELTFSLDTWWEKGHVPSVFLHVPRRNLCKGGKRVGGARDRTPARPPAAPAPQPPRPGRVKGTWCTRPPCRGRGCRDSAGRGCTCRSGCSTCSTPAAASAAAASPAGQWPGCAGRPGCGRGWTFVSLRDPLRPAPPRQPVSPRPNPEGRTWPGSGCSCW